MLQYGEGLPNTHLSITQGVSFHKVCFAHKFFSIIWHVHTCSIFSLFAVAVFGTPARLLHVCLGSVVLALFLKTTFKFFCSFSMDLITNSIWNTASEFWVRSWLFHPDLLTGLILFCAAAGLGKRLPKARRGERSLREGHSRALKCLFELDRS